LLLLWLWPLIKLKNAVLFVVSAMVFLSVEIFGLMNFYWGETTMNNPSRVQVDKMNELMLEYEQGRRPGDAIIVYDPYIILRCNLLR